MTNPTLVLRCQAWNADRAHQVMAGKARAKQFTTAHQSAAGVASFAAFAARFRAEHGSPPLNGQWVARYVTSEQVRGPMGIALPAPLQAIVHAAWCAGLPYGIDYWLDDPDSPSLRAVPLGSLFDPAFGGHVWLARENGWAMCQDCALAAYCPFCQPGWDTDPILGRLPHLACDRHGLAVNA